MNGKPLKTKRIGKHYFRLVGGDNLYYKGELTISFAPLKKNKLILNRSILPTFNNDRKYFTIAFHLPSSTPENDAQLLQDHARRVEEATLQITEILFPKPRSKQKYCGVCRGHYQDYKDHIESECHLLFLKKSIYQGHIVKLCAEYSSQKKDSQENKAAELTSEELACKSMGEVLLGRQISKS